MESHSTCKLLLDPPILVSWLPASTCGAELSIPEALEYAVGAIERRAVPSGPGYAQPREALCWHPVGGSPVD